MKRPGEINFKLYMNTLLFFEIHKLPRMILDEMENVKRILVIKEIYKVVQI